MSKRNPKREPSLGKKLYALFMSVLMVVSLWPSGASVTLADDVVEAPSGSGDGSAAVSAQVSNRPVDGQVYVNNTTYTVNREKDAFLSSAYDNYRDAQAQSTLGTAGSFHITAFDTMTTYSHVYGNILAKTMVGGNNFGLNDAFNNLYNHSALTYVQDYRGSNNMDAHQDGLAVLGSYSNVTAEYGELRINGQRFDSPHNIMQDANTDAAPFIDLDRVYGETKQVSANMASVPDVGTSQRADGNRFYINYEADKGCAYTSMTADQLASIGDMLIIDGMKKTGQCAVVINVDMQGQTSLKLPKTRLKMDGQEVGLGEIDNCGDTGYVLFNFYNAGRGTKIEVGECTASVLAPDADLNLVSSACGTFIAMNVTAYAESHIRPFHGKLEPVVDGVSVKKVWKDAYGDVESNVEHDAVQAQLYQRADGGEWAAYGDAGELSADNGWSYNWSGLPKLDADGTSYEYKVEEVGTVDGYDSSVSCSGTAWTITNQHEAVGKVSASKTWSDSGDKDGLRPSEVRVDVVRIAADGSKETVGTLTLSSDNGWKAELGDLPLSASDGSAYTYELNEHEVKGYTGTVSLGNSSTDANGNVTWEYTLDNAHTLLRRTSVEVSKEWLAATGAAEEGPHPSVEVELDRTVAGVTEKVDTATLSEGAWTHAWSDLLAEDADGNAITYSVRELTRVEGYDSTISGSGSSFTITNKRSATASVSVKKIWDDGNDLDGVRPGSVTLDLTRSVAGEKDESFGQQIVLNAENDWSASVDGLAASDDSNRAYAYDVAEDAVDGYDRPTYSLSRSDDGLSYTFTVTNHRDTNTAYTNVSVDKRWLDAAGNADEGEHPSVEVALYRVEGTGDFEDTGERATLSEGSWSHTWEHLVVKTGDGTQVRYEVREVSVPEGYESSSAHEGDAWVITNKRLAKVSISATKVWDDHDDLDGVRPGSVHVNVLRSGGAQAREKVGEFDLSEANGWAYASGLDYDYADAQGNPFTYELVEDLGENAGNYVAGASCQQETDEAGNVAWSFTLTNTHETGDVYTSVSVSKNWLDAAGNVEAGDHDGVKAILYRADASGNETVVDEQVLNSGNGWAYTWDDLVARDAEGNTFTYRVAEGDVPEGYDSQVVQGDAGSFTLVNKRRATVSVRGSKVWSDNNDLDGIRPDQVRVKLLSSNGTDDPTVVDTFTLDASNGWSFSRDGLPATDAEGRTLAYSVVEDAVDGYETAYASESTVDTAGNIAWSFRVTNRHQTSDHYTNVSVSKSWIDAAGNADEGEHPSVMAQLYVREVGGEWSAVEDGGLVELSASNDWSHAWQALLQRDADGTFYEYQVREAEVPEGFVSETQRDGNAFTLVNRRLATASVSAHKDWADSDDVDGLRPDSLEVTVYGVNEAGERVVAGTFTLNAENDWSASLEGLPTQDANGSVLHYELNEAQVEGYTGSIDGSSHVDEQGNTVYTFSLMNTHEREVTSLKVGKTWDDDDDRDGIRPSFVEVEVLRSVGDSAPESFGEKLVLSDENGWSASVDDLPVNGPDGAYSYSIKEAEVEGYESRVECEGSTAEGYSFSLTNTHEAARTRVDVHKEWDDGDDVDGLRPESVTARLVARGSDGKLLAVEGADDAELCADNGWSASWDGLPAKANGEDIQYSVEEVDVPEGYTCSVSDGISEDGGASYTFTMTNKHQVETVEFALEGYSVDSVTEVLAPSKVCYVDPKVYKVLKGRGLADGEFRFQLIDEQTGEVVSEATNDAAGMIDFDAANNQAAPGMEPCCLKFTAPGEYSYVVKEISDPKDASVEYSDEVIKFVVNVIEDGDNLVSDGGHYYYYKHAGDTIATAVTGPDEHPTITNEVKGIELSLRKSDEAGSALAGATYGLYREGDDGNRVLVATSTSDSDGKMSFLASPSSEQLELGREYWFQEIEAPEGYALSIEESEHFTVETAGNGSDATYYLAYADGTNGLAVTPGTAVPYDHGGGVVDKRLSVVLRKVDSGKNAVKGAQLVVRQESTYEVLDSWTSDGEGHVFSGLAAGRKYVFSEVGVPDGYVRARNVVFTVDERGNVEVLEGGTVSLGGLSFANAAASGSSLTMIDYTKTEETNAREKAREEYERLSKKLKSGASGVESSAVPQTGDTLASPLWIIVAAAAVVATALAIRWRGNR